MKKRWILLFIGFVVMGTSAHAGWKVPITVTSGNVTANAGIGMEAGASNGYDAGRDVPVPEDTSTITASFSHPEWGVTVAGTSLVDFYQEIKGETFPAQWNMDVDTTLSSSHTVKWTIPDNLPKGVSLYLYPPVGDRIDMFTVGTCTFTPSASNRFTIQASLSGTTPPLSPTIIKMTPQDSSLFVEWTGNDPDTAGYKIHFGPGSGIYETTIDVRDVNNLAIKKLANGTNYYVAVTAYNKNGFESSYSAEGQGIPDVQVKYYAISGKIKDARGNGVSGVKVTVLTNPSIQVTTDAGGNYSFAGLTAGAYTVIPGRDTRDRFSPRYKKVSVISSDVTGVDFVLRSRR